MDIQERIASYLGNGGLFNPEYMDHDKVRDLILDLRAELDFLRKKDAATERRLTEERIIARHLAVQACVNAAQGVSLPHQQWDQEPLTGFWDGVEAAVKAIRTLATKETSSETTPKA